MDCSMEQSLKKMEVHMYGVYITPVAFASTPGGRSVWDAAVRTPTRCHIDLACNTSYHFAASHTVFPRVSPYQAQDRLRLLVHVYDSVANIHMTENPGRHDYS